MLVLGTSIAVVHYLARKLFPGYWFGGVLLLQVSKLIIA